jgi:hypothetical protein
LVNQPCDEVEDATAVVRLHTGEVGDVLGVITGIANAQVGKEVNKVVMVISFVKDDPDVGWSKMKSSTAVKTAASVEGLNGLSVIGVLEDPSVYTL